MKWRALLAAFLLCATSIARAEFGDLTSDVGVTLVASRTTNLRPGQPIDMTLNVTNNGPDDLPLAIVATARFVDEYDLLGVNWSECFLFLIVEDGPDGYDYIWNWDVAAVAAGIAPALLVGETRVCHFQIALTSSAPSTYEFSFGLPNGFHDPNPSNDRASVTLQRAAVAPQPVPTLSRAMLMLLTILLGILGIAVRKRVRFLPSRVRC